jgi:hypothetical protein
MFPVSHFFMVIRIGWIQSEFNKLMNIIFDLLNSYINSAGRRTVQSLNQRKDASKSARLLVVPHAGHQLMIDNPDAFHEAVRQALADHKE